MFKRTEPTIILTGHYLYLSGTKPRWDTGKLNNIKCETNRYFRKERGDI
jgi:hypothetical protein